MHTAAQGADRVASWTFVRHDAAFSAPLLRHVVRHLRRHPFLALLNVLSVALGIAVYLAIQIANYSANRSFAAGITRTRASRISRCGDVDETLWPRSPASLGRR
jgi:putative ABC transport system permease protein